MATPAGKLSIRRILVALDASPQSLAALQAAVELSAKLKAELLGLFVEDIDLLMLADSPYARDVLFPTGKDTPLDRSSMERKFKAQAEQARRALVAVANQAKVAWSFRVVRGSVSSEILMAAAGCDLLALGRVGWSLLKKSGIGSTAMAALSEAVPALLLSSGTALAKRPILVWCNGTPASERAVLAAAELAQLESSELIVLLPPSGQQANNHLRNHVVDLVKDIEVEVHCRYLHSSAEGDFLSAMRAIRPSVIILAGKEPFADKTNLLALLDELQVTALFLGQT